MPPRSPKDSQSQDDNDDIDAPRVDEIDPEAIAERAPTKFDSDDDDADDDDIEEIDIEDLAAMEGPDA